jgi:hypothetical protein
MRHRLDGDPRDVLITHGGRRIKLRNRGTTKDNARLTRRQPTDRWIQSSWVGPGSLALSLSVLLSGQVPLVIDADSTRVRRAAC